MKIQIKPNFLNATIEFSVKTLVVASSLYVSHYFMSKSAENARILYAQYCTSPYDRIACGAFYAKKEMNGFIDISINKVGGIFMLALIITATAQATGMLYRKFTKRRSCV